MSDPDLIIAGENNGAGKSSKRVGDIVGDITDATTAAGAGPNFIDPASVTDQPGAGPGATDPGATPGKRGRGRPRKAGTGQATAASSVKAKRPVDAEGLSAILMAIHLGVATLVKTPELELEQAESDKLANASVGVAKHYNIEASEKALAWTNLAVVGFSTYGPRVFAMRLRWENEKNEAAQKRAAQNAASIVNPALRSAI